MEREGLERVEEPGTVIKTRGCLGNDCSTPIVRTVVRFLPFLYVFDRILITIDHSKI